MRIVTITDIIVLLAGLAILVFWFILYKEGEKQYAGLFENLKEEDFPMKELYFVGYALQNKLHMEYKSAYDRKLYHQLVLLYGEKYASYYLRVVYSRQFTMAMMVAAMAAPMYFLTNSVPLFLLFLILAAVTSRYYGLMVQDDVDKRSSVMLLEFPEVVSKLALLVNAGMILREAWEQVAYSEEGILYREMQNSVIDMQNGKNEQDALIDFGQRCGVPQVKKFSSTLAQGVMKGNRELAPMMIQQSEEAWNVKKQEVKRAGEAASAKLLLPIVLTFIGILTMVIVPVFANLGT